MKQKKLKLNIHPPQTPSTKEEDKKRLVEYVGLLLSWHLEEQKSDKENNLSP